MHSWCGSASGNRIIFCFLSSEVVMIKKIGVLTSGGDAPGMN
ncbi:ATP-dependent 6-phosphofructokinase, partial [Acinetobacter baumannii]|nr:ATP-dependent 6-phosphofructokinase [Acinetobacter baumannii]